MIRLVRSLLLVGLVLGVGTRILSTPPPAAYLPPARTTAGATVVVVFIPVDQTAGFFHHAFILFSRPDQLLTAHGAYKTEALGGGSRDFIGIPSFVAPTAPHVVTASAELLTATMQDCHMPAYLVPPWATCSWEDFSLILQTSKSVSSLRASFAQTARCFTMHPVRYSVWGPNTNTYAFTALHNAGLPQPGAAPSAAAAPGWGSLLPSPCTRR